MNNQAHQRANHTHGKLLIFTAVSIAGAFLLVWTHGLLPHRSSAGSLALIADQYKKVVAPEPEEQFTFAMLAALMPILAFASAAWVRGGHRSIIGARMGGVTAVVVAALFLVPFPGSDFAAAVIRGFYPPASSDLAILSCALIASTALCSMLALRPWQRRVSGLFASWPWAVFLGAMLLQVASWRLVGFATVQPDFSWSIHADALFYVIAQVYAGKTILVDLPSQYGLFAEFLGPIFRIVGLSVDRVVAVFAILQMLSLTAVFYALSKYVKSHIVLAITGVALIQLTFETVFIQMGYIDRYWQYWPLRFFWPAMSVAAFHWFSRRPTLTKSTLISALGALALLWNLDSGLFTSFAFGAYLLARGVMLTIHRPTVTGVDSWRPINYARALALHVAATAAVVAAFLGALAVKSGELPRVAGLIEYQKVFADVGLSLMPMPLTPHPWMAVLGVYLCGMLAAFASWRRSDGGTIKANMVAYLSLLGLGLFVYYAGRSHVLNLVKVCWPAAILAAIGVDVLLRAVQARVVPRSTISIPVVGFALLLVAAGSFAFRVPAYSALALHEFKTRGVPTNPTAFNEVEFIKKWVQPKSECLIFSLRQGVYEAQARISSPFVGPGIIETVLRADERRLIDTLLAGQYSCVFLGTSPSNKPNIKIDVQRLMQAYTVIDRSPDGTLLYMTPTRK